MPPSIVASKHLRVEGPDDREVIGHLLRRHGIELPEFGSFVRPMGGVETLLDNIVEAVSAGVGQTVGFVLDADQPLAVRWQSVRERLVAVGVDVPEAPPAGGFIGESGRFHTRVGVWLMPDCISDGTLEEFLARAIPTNDPLMAYARDTTAIAHAHGAHFAPTHLRKAELHAWLAWQEDPGKSLGVAVTAQYFRHDTPEALAFLAWFRTLFTI